MENKSEAHGPERQENYDNSSINARLGHKPNLGERVGGFIANVTGHKGVIGSHIHRSYEALPPYLYKTKGKR